MTTRSKLLDSSSKKSPNPLSSIDKIMSILRQEDPSNYQSTQGDNSLQRSTSPQSEFLNKSQVERFPVSGCKSHQNVYIPESASQDVEFEALTRMIVTGSKLNLDDEFCKSTERKTQNDFTDKLALSFTSIGSFDGKDIHKTSQASYWDKTSHNSTTRSCLPREPLTPSSIVGVIDGMRRTLESETNRKEHVQSIKSVIGILQQFVEENSSRYNSRTSTGNGASNEKLETKDSSIFALQTNEDIENAGKRLLTYFSNHTGQFPADICQYDTFSFRKDEETSPNLNLQNFRDPTFDERISKNNDKGYNSNSLSFSLSNPNRDTMKWEDAQYYGLEEGGIEITVDQNEEIVETEYKAPSEKLNEVSFDNRFNYHNMRGFESGHAEYVLTESRTPNFIKAPSKFLTTIEEASHEDTGKVRDSCDSFHYSLVLEGGKKPSEKSYLMAKNERILESITEDDKENMLSSDNRRDPRPSPRNATSWTYGHETSDKKPDFQEFMNSTVVTSHSQYSKGAKKTEKPTGSSKLRETRNYSRYQNY